MATIKGLFMKRLKSDVKKNPLRKISRPTFGRPDLSFLQRKKLNLPLAPKERAP